MPEVAGHACGSGDSDLTRRDAMQRVLETLAPEASIANCLTLRFSRHRPGVQRACSSIPEHEQERHQQADERARDVPGPGTHQYLHHGTPGSWSRDTAPNATTVRRGSARSRMATSTPDAAVSAPITLMATGMPNASASTPASSAPAT